MEHKIGRPALNLTDQKFGRLTALVLVQDRPLKRRWKCRCACGRYCTVDQGKLRHGETRSCGCLVSENALKRINQHTLPAGTAFMNATFKMYVLTAKNKNRPFTLTRAEFENKITKSCYYCGAQPRLPLYAERLRRRKIKWFNGVKAINGLDRKNNNLGYTKRNTVPCCRTCNIAKHTMSAPEFLAWALRVVKQSSVYIKTYEQRPETNT